ncbi:hypothetical protein BH11GEM1_BH11GEM1_23910 [soil metagenome]
MRLSRWAAAGFLGVFALVCGRILEAQTATQTVTFSVVSSSRAAIASVATPMTVRAAITNGTSTSASVAGSSYAITTNESNQKISASLNEAMPSGLSLAVSLSPPAGAASRGVTQLGATATDVVTGISAADAASLPLVYTLTASGVPTRSNRRVVTYTVTSGL